MGNNKQNIDTTDTEQPEFGTIVLDRATRETRNDCHQQHLSQVSIIAQVKN